MNESQPIEKINLAESHPNELESISAAIKNKEKNYSERGIEKERRDIIREAVAERTSLTTSAQAKEDEMNLGEKIRLAKKNEQLRYILNYAAEQGPIKASLLVRKFGDAWLDDQFHDILLKTHDELVAKKQIKEE